MTSPPPKNPSSNLGDRVAAERAAALVGTVLSGRYKLVELLAMGGVGAVYLGEHVKMHKHVAIKVLHPDAQSLPELSARFEREAVAGAHIQHPNVASATDFGELEDGSHFLVLEYVRGATLREVIKRGALSAARTVGIAKQIAAGLAATHAVGIVHRDLKPRNVMLIEGERDVVKIIDFGLAKLNLKEVSEVAAKRASMSDHQITGTGAVFGTIAYLAPEAALGMDAVDARADLYAFGLVLYEMLAGKHPFDTADPVGLFKHHARTVPPPIGERSPGVVVPPALEAIIARLLEKRREDRYPSAEAVLRDLESVFDPTAITPTPSPVSIGDGVFPGPSILPPAPLSQPGPPPPSKPSPAPPPLSISPAPPSATTPSAVHDLPPPAQRSPRVGRARWPFVAGAVGLGLTALAIAWPLRDRAGAAPAVESAVTAVTAPASVAPAAIATAIASATATASATAIASTSTIPSASAPAGEAGAAPSAPFDGSVARATLRRATAARDHARALEAFLALAEHEPAAFRDPQVALAARDLAAVIAVAGGEGADRLFEVLGHKLGGDGLDVLYEVVRVRGGSKAAIRAEPLLREPGAMERASPALRITFALREAPCPDKPALFDRAVAEGDVRTLMVLESSAAACVGPRNKPLEAAIKALRQRLR